MLLVEPDYYSRYPPLGLLKISAYYKSIKTQVKYVRGITKISNFIPDTVEITSLFTYSRKNVHKAIQYYHNAFPQAQINVGGIYASLLPTDLKNLFPYIEIQLGLNIHAEHLMPDYSILSQVEKWKNWDGSIIFTSRGCINKCGFCMVPKLEGDLRNITNTPSRYIVNNHSKVIIWDNNFLAQPDWYEKIIDLKKTGKWIDFNQGLDTRLITDEKAEALASMKIKDYRFAYDGDYQEKYVKNTIDLLSSHGVNKRRISFYTLYNFYNGSNNYDDPDNFYHRVLNILEWGSVSYPMRYVPLDADNKNTFVSPYWSEEQLEMVAQARRVIGFGGAFPPYQGLINKFKNANNFDEAFRLKPIEKKRVA